MTRLTGEVLIDAAPSEVFDTVADERNEPNYNPRIARAEMLTAGPVGPGPASWPSPRVSARAAGWTWRSCSTSARSVCTR